MSGRDNMFSTKSELSNFLTSSKKIVNKKLNCSRRSRKKNSVEDLIDEGFTIGHVLGEGSYCKVKAARYKEKDIAVKIITKEQLSIDFETKFMPREIEILSQIKHRNIITVYQIYKYPHRVFIFMELIRRGDLLAFIRERGRLMESEACRYFQQMICAVQYLHGKNIAHRDLKCENIMITDSDVIKLIDFGFCRRTKDVNDRRVLSETFCGSTAYASPEVLQGIPYNPMMYDVWSLGCVLFIMVTGTMPFDDSNVRKMVTYQLNRRFRYPGTFLLTKQLKSVVSRMLEPDVTRRATINHISQSSWIIENKGYSLNSTKPTIIQRNISNGTNNPSTQGATSSSRSIGTQTTGANDSVEFNFKSTRIESNRS